jgi:FkbM family methyltransferase
MKHLLKSLAPYALVTRRARKRSEQVHISAQEQLYRNFVSKGDLVFDVGSNLGNRIEALLNCRAKVIAIEPQPECANHLRRIYSENPNVVIIQAAAGAKKGTMPLHRSTSSDPTASMSKGFMEKTAKTGRFGKSKQWTQVIDVPVIKLDAVIEEHGLPSFIKIDVEGFEIEVLSGLSKAVKAISFEWTPETREQTSLCLERCENLGMRHFHISFNESMRFAHSKSLSRNDMETLIQLLAEETILFGDIYALSTCIPRL